MHEESKVDYFVMKREARFGDFTNYEVVKRIPSADVAPVRHGRWEEYGKTWWCSECGFETGLRWDYCPDCGAKMDE